jgi:hypothetical protein
MRKTSESKSSLEAPRSMYRCQNLLLVSRRRKAWKKAGYWPSDIRRADGVILIWALVRNYGNHPVAYNLKGTRGKPSRPIVGATDEADSPVLAVKAGNSAGAKGRSQYRWTYSQPACREEL